MVNILESRAITGSTDVVRYFDCMFEKDIDHEEVWVMFLDSSNKPLSLERIGIGNINSTVVDVRRIVKIALNNNTTAVILFHNHMSDNVLPSVADIKSTEKLKSACDLFDISLVDHIIVGKDKYYSFVDERQNTIKTNKIIYDNEEE